MCIAYCAVNYNQQQKSITSHHCEEAARDSINVTSSLYANHATRAKLRARGVAGHNLYSRHGDDHIVRNV